jgi:hypothetical protein
MDIAISKPIAPPLTIRKVNNTFATKLLNKLVQIFLNVFEKVSTRKKDNAASWLLTCTLEN